MVGRGPRRSVQPPYEVLPLNFEHPLARGGPGLCTLSEATTVTVGMVASEMVNALGTKRLQRMRR